VSVSREAWDLQLEVIDILGEPGCGWGYEVGFKTLWDGRRYPMGMCPFAWNAFSPWVWALRYSSDIWRGGRSSGEAAEMQVVCPDPRHLVVWRIQRVGDDIQVLSKEVPSRRRPYELKIEVSELPNGSGCGRGYTIGDSWLYDGHIPEGFCPLAWNALSLWVWPLRYGGSPRAMEWPGEDVSYGCPEHEHPVVFRVSRHAASKRQLCGS
jgi:uncharacterized repeat protein (TIGR04076 family)